MNTYTFKLYRRVHVKGGVIISAFDIDRECKNPFRERLKLSHEYPGWGVGNDFKSDIDHEFEELNFTFKIQAGNTLKGPTTTDASFDNPDEDDCISESE